MSFVDRVAGNPLGCIGGCLVWIPVGIWIYLAISWMIMGEVDILPGILCIGVAFCLGYFSANPPTPQLGFVFMGTAAGSLLAIPVVRSITRARMLSNIHEDQLEGFCETLRLKPNPGTEFRIAEVLWDNGDADRAIAIAERVLPQLNPNLFANEHREYRLWLMRTQRPPNQSAGREQRCLKCSRVAPLDAIICLGCRSPLVIQASVSDGTRLMARIIGGWTMIVALLLFLPIAAVQLPSAAAIPVIVLGVLGGSYFMWRLLGREFST